MNKSSSPKNRSRKLTVETLEHREMLSANSLLPLDDDTSLSVSDGAHWTAVNENVSTSTLTITDNAVSDNASKEAGALAPAD
jgi:hypothetical protein